MSRCRFCEFVGCAVSVAAECRSLGGECRDELVKAFLKRRHAFSFKLCRDIGQVDACRCDVIPRATSPARIGVDGARELLDAMGM